MTAKRSDIGVVTLAHAAFVPTTETAPAQGEPHMSETQKTGSTGSQDPRSTGSVGRSSKPLGEKLGSTIGLVRPPGKIAHDMGAHPPVSDPGTPGVIPAPGGPGGDPNLEPK